MPKCSSYLFPLEVPVASPMRNVVLVKHSAIDATEHVIKSQEGDVIVDEGILEPAIYIDDHSGKTLIYFLWKLKKELFCFFILSILFFLSKFFCSIFFFCDSARQIKSNSLLIIAAFCFYFVLMKII